MDIKSLNRVIEQISDERGIDKNIVLEAVESAVAAAYRKEYGKRGEIIKAKIDRKTGKLNFWKIRIVVDQTTAILEPVEKEEVKEGEEKIMVYNADRHIWIEEAKEIKPDVILGEEMEFPLETHEDFGRIAAQAAKQVVLQKIREAERDSVKKEYLGKEGEIVSGIVQRIDRGNVFVDIGRAVGVMFFNETIPGEYYRIGQRMKFYLLAVQEESGKMPGLVLSRSHPKFVSKLFEIEVPEIHENTVEIKSIAREAGNRTKIAVASNVDGVDPVGACVGQRGTRVMAVTNELGQEKIDIIEWSENPEKFVAASLSPAKVKDVEISAKREAKVFVPEDQLSLAIGKAGQNVRLAAKLTGWKIDVRSLARPEEAVTEGIAEAVEEAKEVTPEAEVEKEEGKE
ncbi:transcription termination factor NusA [Candidatus Wolfebacteria bacterium RIFCSPLOWO2_01_FULL_38_11]|uniref:Transcription termination/antitermination protein NusA n=2 Tax=Candidatus Wolfeibacteriota TaxID=1752735 RepID=A0A0G0G6V4_9BACT|nr:MAG: NusA antitermination factor [Candidatus Wolfebacteria bacterium GW2011_GWC1_37_10]OGM91100.1 MAG: transcription termination factor NusA [Candidatus Wolfebacteria bacterium RIFCSPLOWO2_01_FULL_38_11]